MIMKKRLSIDFKTKEQYLAYIKEWKADYKELSSNIRASRFVGKAHQRNLNIYIDRKWQRQRPFTPTEQKYIDQVVEAKKVWGCYYWSLIAKEMLDELQCAKVEAQKQYLAQKTKVDAT